MGSSKRAECRTTPLTSQSRCEGGKMRVLIGLLVHGILQTQQKSQLSLLVASLWITRLSLASLVSGCTTALYTVEMADNGVEPRTSTTVTIGYHWNIPNAHTPCCQVASVILRVCSIAHRGNWVAPVALDLLCDRAYSFPHQDKSSWAAVSTCNWTSPKSDWAAPVTLTKKGRKVSKTWWGGWIRGCRK